MKIAAVALYFCYLLYKKYPLRKASTGLTVFYLLMPIVGMAGALIHGSFHDSNYKYAYLFGTGIWLLAAAASWLTLVFARQVGYESLKATLKIFFAINLAVSLGQLLFIMYSSQNIMPYWYQDAAEQYGISTGDYIKGLTGNTSVVNGAIATLGILFFYFQKQWRWLFVCLLTMVLCTTNLTLLCLLFTLMILCIFVKGRPMKLRAAVLFISTIGMYWFVSPRNIIYIEEVFIKIFSQRAHGPLSERELYYKEHKEAFFRLAVKDSTYKYYSSELAALKQESATDTAKRHSVLSSEAIGRAMNKWYGLPADSTPLHFVAGPGKLYGFKQTIFYIFQAPQNWPAGAGMGNFSSHLAIKATGLGIEGSYPDQYNYISRDFFRYHLYNILYYYSLSASEHSVMNMPDNVYDQLLGEYGLAGLLLFFVFYPGYLWKHRGKMSYGRYLLCIVLLFFGYEYWFEMITLTVFFELLMFMDIFVRERKNGDPGTDNSINAGI